MIVVYFSDREFIACDPHDEERVKADFFKTRDPKDFKRVAVGDYAYVRAAAAHFSQFPGFGPPRLNVTTNLSEHKL